jgi:hypothetical protein
LSTEINLTEIVEGLFITGVAGIQVYERIKLYFKEKGKKHNIKELNMMDLKIYEKLAECKTKYKADRCLFFQFHNGEIFLNNNSILKMSLSHESNNDGIIQLKNEFQTVLISVAPNFIHKLIEHESFQLDTHSSGEDFIKNFKFYGIESVMVHRVEDKKKKVIGFVCVCYHTHLQHRDFEPLKDLSEHIGFLI